MSISDETERRSSGAAGGQRPLRDGGERAAARIAEVNRVFEPAPREQAAAWARLQDALPGAAGARPSGAARRWAWLSLLVGAGASAALLFLVLRGVDTAPRPGGAPATPPTIARRDPMPPEAAFQPPAPRESPRAEETAPVSLRPGRTLIAGAVRARLSSRGVAALRSPAGLAPRFDLERGTLEMDVSRPVLDPEGRGGGGDAPGPATPSGRAAVQVASYRLVLEQEAAPARFSVSARRGRVTLKVQTGEITVWSSTRLVARVVAGQRWTSAPARTGAGGVAAAAPERAPSGDESAPTEAPEGAAAAATGEPPDCARLTRDGAIDRALACFEAEATQPGLAGELALIELARIRRDVKGDLAGAERALEEYRRRFPRGSLGVEATGSRVELLLHLGRPAEALAESERLPAGEGTFWRAVCLLKLGRPAEAGRALDAYLARGDGKRRAEALRMRREIAP